MKNILIIFIVITLISCQEQNVQPTHDLEQAFDYWKSLGIDSYNIIQIKKCFCVDAGLKVILQIKSNQIISVEDSLGVVQIPKERWKYFKTINQLFETAIEAKKNKPANFIIEYDEIYKYPTYLYVNPSSHAVDDEYEISTYNLIPQR